MQIDDDMVQVGRTAVFTGGAIAITIIRSGGWQFRPAGVCPGGWSFMVFAACQRDDLADQSGRSDPDQKHAGEDDQPVRSVRARLTGP